MRTAFVSLIALVGFAGVAAAQQPTSPAAPAAAPAAAQPSTPPVAAPATVPPPTAPAAAPAPAVAAPAAQAPAASTVPDASANPPLPTEGDAAALLSLLDKVCVPAVKGGTLDQLARAAGMKKTRDGGYTVALGADRTFTATIQPQGSNRNVCQMDVRYAVGGEKPIISALNIWSFKHDPELKLRRNDFNVGADNVKRVTLSWEYYTDKASTGLVFVQLKNADGSSMNARYDSGTLLYSERTFP
jgi:hypothetical protein